MNGVRLTRHYLKRMLDKLQRYAMPEDIANLICYLCSKASSATNGAALRVDGGIHQPVLIILPVIPA
jgi:NAD(P)-dependent dehydrogenase (short-subunit alcohol dehydrogenase family)